MTALLAVAVIYHTVFQCISSTPIDCESFRSELSAMVKGALIEVECQDGYETMVSCGYETYPSIGMNSTFYGGSWINDSDPDQVKCTAMNQNNGTGIYAHARCCNFAQDVECISEFATCQTSDLSISKCAVDEYMLGCSASNYGDHFGGLYPGTEYPDFVNFSNDNSSLSYPMSNRCNAIHGDETDVESQVNCCTASVGLQCDLHYQHPGQPTNWLSCPKNQTLISCMGVNEEDINLAKYVIFAQVHSV